MRQYRLLNVDLLSRFVFDYQNIGQKHIIPDHIGTTHCTWELYKPVAEIDQQHPLWRYRSSSRIRRSRRLYQHTCAVRQEALIIENERKTQLGRHICKCILNHIYAMMKTQVTTTKTTVVWHCTRTYAIYSVYISDMQRFEYMLDAAQSSLSGSSQYEERYGSLLNPKRSFPLPPDWSLTWHYVWLY